MTVIGFIKEHCFSKCHDRHGMLKLADKISAVCVKDWLLFELFSCYYMLSNKFVFTLGSYVIAYLVIYKCIPHLSEHLHTVCKRIHSNRFSIEFAIGRQYIRLHDSVSFTY